MTGGAVAGRPLSNNGLVLPLPVLNSTVGVAKACIFSSARFYPLYRLHSFSRFTACLGLSLQLLPLLAWDLSTVGVEKSCIFKSARFYSLYSDVIHCGANNNARFFSLYQNGFGASASSADWVFEILILEKMRGVDHDTLLILNQF